MRAAAGGAGSRRVVLRHARGAVAAGFAVLCAGAWSDRIARLAGADPDPRIVPFRGAYLRLRADRRALVRGLIYPVPDPSLPFLGVHLTRHHGGDVLIGPTALLAPARGAYRLRTVRRADVGETLRWPGTPLARPRRSSSSSPASSPAERATITLPQRSYAIPRSAQ